MDDLFVANASPPETAGASNALPFKSNTPISGSNLPNDPELPEYPLVSRPVYTVPAEPDTNSNTLPASVNVVVVTT